MAVMDDIIKHEQQNGDARRLHHRAAVREQPICTIACGRSQRSCLAGQGRRLRKATTKARTAGQPAFRTKMVERRVIQRHRKTLADHRTANGFQGRRTFGVPCGPMILGQFRLTA